MNERLEIVIQSLGMQKKAFAQAVGMNPTSLSRVLSGRSAVTQDLISEIVKQFGVNRKWIESGDDAYPIFDEKINPAILQVTQSNSDKSMENELINRSLIRLQDQVYEMQVKIGKLEDRLNALESPLKKKNNAG